MHKSLYKLIQNHIQGRRLILVLCFSFYGFYVVFTVSSFKGNPVSDILERKRALLGFTYIFIQVNQLLQTCRNFIYNCSFLGGVGGETIGCIVSNFLLSGPRNDRKRVVFRYSRCRVLENGTFHGGCSLMLLRPYGISVQLQHRT